MAAGLLDLRTGGETQVVPLPLADRLRPQQVPVETADRLLAERLGRLRRRPAGALDVERRPAVLDRIRQGLLRRTLELQVFAVRSF